ncbi:4485_t:CDS:2 [Paraglomus brasilianum]|uniref:4485_t:CDS:1 n=1 Tax=Paraglomus brasilianum TaxID=144538 RepID=A0A9N9DKC7_9GLOM|nr:4485_t:CDS:2 [Paraglomus brasilianum]
MFNKTRSQTPVRFSSQSFSSNDETTQQPSHVHIHGVDRRFISPLVVPTPRGLHGLQLNKTVPDNNSSLMLVVVEHIIRCSLLTFIRFYLGQFSGHTQTIKEVIKGLYSNLFILNFHFRSLHIDDDEEWSSTENDYTIDM